MAQLPKWRACAHDIAHHVAGPSFRWTGTAVASADELTIDLKRRIATPAEVAADPAIARQVAEVLERADAVLHSRRLQLEACDSALVRIALQERGAPPRVEFTVRDLLISYAVNWTPPAPPVHDERYQRAVREGRGLTDYVLIDTYRPEYQPLFEALNRDWLESNGLLEPHDVAVLQNPQRYFIDPGGELFVASVRGELVGTVAIVPETDARYELAKLAVRPSARGLGIGRKLAQTAIAFATSRGAREIVLSSNSSLRVAIQLYESLGFQHVPPPATPTYVTADVHMALTL